MEPAARDKVPQVVAELASPILDDLALELVDVQFRRTGRRWLLRLFVDKRGGVTLDECARVSTALGRVLDVEDVITDRYTLEVSSPGLDRPLVTDRDFLRCVERRVLVRLREPVEERQQVEGVLKGLANGDVLLDVDGVAVTVPRAAIAKATLVIRW